MREGLKNTPQKTENWTHLYPCCCCYKTMLDRFSASKGAGETEMEC